ncbi:MAG: hypothetical protein LC798_18695 [Chloroflexi bacterium]|nr:hypothetical protein [Chloroflexota bacterium]
MSSRTHLLMLLVAACAIGACDAGPGPSTPATMETDAAPSAVAPTDEWGPMAVWDDAGSSGGDMALLTGILAIDDQCVTVGENTLVWGASQVQWNPETTSILFNDPLARVVVELAPGDNVELGGGGAADPPWIAEPDESCPGERFGVGNIESVNGIEP